MKNKIIAYVNETNIEDLIELVNGKGKDPESVLEQIKQAGVEFTAKMVEYRHVLESMIEEKNK